MIFTVDGQGYPGGPDAPDTPNDYKFLAIVDFGYPQGSMKVEVWATDADAAYEAIRYDAGVTAHISYPREIE
jgi:hypothetical protein